MNLHAVAYALVLFPIVAFSKVSMTGLAVYPADVKLQSARAHQSLVVQGTFSDSSTRDLASSAAWSIEPQGIAQLEKGKLTPLSDGNAVVTVRAEGFEQKVTVEVTQAKEERPISFELDVMPVFMKAGCNMGSCHGSARGQDGFMLSLFGYDADGDYKRITREFSGRRINLARPEASLLIQKSIGAVPHTGGKCLEPGSDQFNTIVRWLDAMAPKDGDDVASPTDLELHPQRIVLRGEGKQQTLTVVAHYSDGTRRDVTSLAVIESNNKNSASIHSDSAVESHRRGEAFVTARFATHTVGTHVIVVPDAPAPVWPDDLKAHNYIDGFVHAKLKRMDMLPSAVCDDETYLRRVSLDVAGVMPSAAEVQRFVADTAPDKRAKVVDDLLARKDFVDLWVMKWAELLQIRSSNETIEYKPALLYHSWLKEKLSAGDPIDRIIRELLTAQGGTFSQPQSNYFEIEKDTLKTAENVAQVFMGVRLQCAQCHNHPFDRWTMDDYYSFAAFFSRIGRKRGEDPREKVIFDKFNGETKHPLTNQDMLPRFPDGTAPEIKPANQRRAVFANWLTAPDNPYFSKNLANLVWAQLMGQGVVEPVDDVRVSNPPSNPELLDALAAKLVDANYDFRVLIRDITASRTYQLSTQVNETNKGDTRNFAKAQVRRIRAEVLLDCVSQVTGTQDKFKGLAKGSRAVEIADGSTSTYFLTTFGRAKRESACSCEVVTEPNLSQALHLLNGDTIHKKIHEGGVVKKLLKDGVQQKAIVDHLYLSCLARTPTADERAKLQPYLSSDNQEQQLNELFWALLNSKEFVFNH